MQKEPQIVSGEKIKRNNANVKWAVTTVKNK